MSQDIDNRWIIDYMKSLDRRTFRGFSIILSALEEAERHIKSLEAEIELLKSKGDSDVDN